MKKSGKTEMSGQSRPPTVQSAAVGEQEQDIWDSSDVRPYVHNTFTISKRLTDKEAIQLLRDFGNYMKQKSDSEYIDESSIDKPAKEVFNNWGFKGNGYMKVSTQGRSYHSDGVTWEIKRYNGKHNSFEFYEYFIDIIGDQLLIDSEKTKNKPYNGDFLKTVMDTLIEESKKMSPLLDDYSSFELTRVEYCVGDLEYDSIFSPELLADLTNRSNIYANYSEWETYSAEPSNDRGTKNFDFRDDKLVELDYMPDGSNALYYTIQRIFRKGYPLKKLVEEDSVATKFIIEQMFSKEYAERSAAIYLSIAIMGGSYYSMDEAIRIIKSSSLTGDRKYSLICTLELVDKHKGICGAKLHHRDDRGILFDLINNLHELVEMGINPVTIPDEYRSDKRFMNMLPNPIPKLSEWYNRGRDMKNNWNIEVEETIGTLLPFPCRIEPKL